MNSSRFEHSNIDQLDGNATVSTVVDESLGLSLTQSKPNKFRKNRASVATHLPVVTVCNMRSLFPKINNFKIDLIERQVDVSLCCEIWEKAEDKKHRYEIEKMLEIDGLKYFSTPRPKR